MLSIAEFFQNEALIKYICEEFLSRRLSVANCLKSLKWSYEKLAEGSENEESRYMQYYFDLFYCSIEFVAEQLIEVINDQPRFYLGLSEKIVEEVLERFFTMQIVRNRDNTFISEEDYDNIVPLIVYIRNFEKGLDVFELINNEMKVLVGLDKNFKSELGKEEPKFQFKISKDIVNYYYNEHLIDIDKQKLSFLLIYKNTNDTFNISLKLVEANSIKKLSISYITDLEGTDDYYFDVKYLNANLHTSLVKINKFKSKVNHSPMFKVHVKMNYIHSFLLNYALLNFSKFYDLESVGKLSKTVLNLILSSEDLDSKVLEDNKLTCISIWRKF